MISQILPLNRGTLVAFAALLLVVSLTSVAMSDTVFGESDNEDYVGTRDEGSMIAQAAPVESSGGNTAQWGVFAYESDRGLTCLQAGVMKDGNVGAYTENEFHPFSPRDSVGNCGDPAGALAAQGGLAYAAEAPASNNVADRSGVIYGLVSNVTAVTVTVDGSSQAVPVELEGSTAAGGADGVFIAPLPAGTELPGVTVTFELENGATTVSRI